ncbi:sugar phosphate isomerase/epimerase [Phenylobacterium sp. LjRoot219]|uniref:sugar phosphate isomerase/epimerase family protein n=1 Tax=Phenylobacterium sp. LjRoot219 TaxID=3342283 RepID=UPI003ECD6468
MTHPRLSISALSSFHWSFEQDLALWRELDLPWAGLLISKIADDIPGKVQRVTEAGIRISTVVTGAFDLAAPKTWEAQRGLLRSVFDALAATGGGTVYLPPGRTTGAPWGEVLEVFAAAVAPSVEEARSRGVRLGFEPSLRTDVSFVNTLRDAVDVSERTGLGLVADFGNCWMERDLAQVLQRAAPHICLAQICDVLIGAPGRPSPGGRAHIGEGELPVRRLLQEVLATGYQGPFDLEVLGPEIEKEGYGSAIRRGAQLASALLAEAAL